MAIQTIHSKDLPLAMRKAAAAKTLQKLRERANSQTLSTEQLADIHAQIEKVIAWASDETSDT